jgi:hypothetical protein
MRPGMLQASLTLEAIGSHSQGGRDRPADPLYWAKTMLNLVVGGHEKRP